MAQSRCRRLLRQSSTVSPFNAIRTWFIIGEKKPRYNYNVTGDLDEVKVMVRDVKNNSKVPDKSLRLLVNASQHLREVVRKEAVGVEAPIEGRKGDDFIDYHGMTALAFAAKL